MPQRPGESEHRKSYLKMSSCLPFTQRRIGSRKLSGQGTERYYFSGIARVTKKKPESHLVWYSDANSGSRDGTFDARARQ